MDRTLIIVKPHAVKRGLTGSFLERFERMGLRIRAIKVLNESREFWTSFYPSHESWFKNAGGKTLENCRNNKIDVRSRLGTDDPIAIGRMVKAWLVEHMTSGDAIAAVLEGNEALNKVRIACGHTLPNMASPGTIRFDFSTDSPALANEERRPVYNLIHASDPSGNRDDMSEAQYEIRLVFPELCC